MINWGMLVSKGRAKAIGVSWSPEEEYALYTLGIPVDLVRKGILTKEEAEDELATKDMLDFKLIRSMTKEEIKTLANELGVAFPEEAKRLEIISLIKNSKLPDSDPSDNQESLE